MFFFDAGQYARALRNHFSAVLLCGAHQRFDGGYQDTAGDAGEEDQQIGDPIAQFLVLPSGGVNLAARQAGGLVNNIILFQLEH